MLFESNHIQNGDDCLTVGNGAKNIHFQVGSGTQKRDGGYLRTSQLLGAEFADAFAGHV